MERIFFFFFFAAKKLNSSVLRLAPDMFVLARQIQITTDQAKNGSARLARIEPALRGHLDYHRAAKGALGKDCCLPQDRSIAIRSMLQPSSTFLARFQSPRVIRLPELAREDPCSPSIPAANGRRGRQLAATTGFGV